MNDINVTFLLILHSSMEYDLTSQICPEDFFLKAEKAIHSLELEYI